MPVLSSLAVNIPVTLPPLVLADVVMLNGLLANCVELTICSLLLLAWSCVLF